MTLKKGQRWARMDLNHRPSGYEPRALPLSYGPDEGKKIISYQTYLQRFSA